MSEAAVAAIVFDKTKEKFLLVQRRDVPVWVLPGGGVDPGEVPEDAVVREVQEESGVEARIVRKVARYTPVGRLACETHLFECEYVSGQPGASDETLAADFFSLDAYPPPVFDVHRNWILDALANKAELIEKPVQGLGPMMILKMMVKHPVLSARYLLSRIGLTWNTQ